MDVVYCIFNVGWQFLDYGCKYDCAFILAAIVVTVATFETAKRRPTFFQDFPTSTPSRSRMYMWMNGQKIKLTHKTRVANMNKIKQFWHETDSIEMVLFATLWSLFGYGAYVVILALIDRE